MGTEFGDKPTGRHLAMSSIHGHVANDYDHYDTYQRSELRKLHREYVLEVRPHEAIDFAFSKLDEVHDYTVSRRIDSIIAFCKTQDRSINEVERIKLIERHCNPDTFNDLIEFYSDAELVIDSERARRLLNDVLAFANNSVFLDQPLDSIRRSVLGNLIHSTGAVVKICKDYSKVKSWDPYSIRCLKEDISLIRNCFITIGLVPWPNDLAIYTKTINNRGLMKGINYGWKSKNKGEKSPHDRFKKDSQIIQAIEA